MPALPTVNGLETQPPLDVRNLFPAPLPVATRQFAAPYCQGPATESTDPATGVITVRNQCFGTGVQYANPTNTTPYTQNWGLNIQFEPREGMLFEIGYQGSHGLHAQSFYHANQATLPPTAGNPNNSLRWASQCPAGTYPATCSPIQDRVPYGNFIPQLSTYVNDNNAIYHAMTLKLEQRFKQRASTADGLYLEPDHRFRFGDSDAGRNAAHLSAVQRPPGPGARRRQLRSDSPVCGQRCCMSCRSAKASSF